MDFGLTEEQQMIRETAAQFLADNCDSAAVRRAMATESGFEPQMWQRIAGEMCWTAIHIPEEYGGLGLGYVELVAVMEQMGRYLLCAPYFSSVCLGANALLLAGSVLAQTPAKGTKNSAPRIVSDDVKLMEGGTLTAKSKGNDVMVMDEKGGTAQVTIADVYQSNGVIHVVDKVLMPK